MTEQRKTPGKVRRLAALCGAGGELREAALRQAAAGGAATALAAVRAEVPSPAKAGNSAAHASDKAKAGVDQEWVVLHLREVAERCMQAVPPPAPKAGAEPAPGVWKFDAGSAIRALNLLGKQMGMFSDKVEHQVSVHEDALEELE